MIYGRPPFYAITGAVPKLRAISDPNHVIDYPAQSIPTAPSSEKDGAPRQLLELATPVPPDVVDTLKGCLTRDPKQRRTIPELLDDPWLRSWRRKYLVYLVWSLLSLSGASKCLRDLIAD